MRAAVVVLGLALAVGAQQARAQDGGPPVDEKAAWIAAVHQRIHPRWTSFLIELRRLPDPKYQDMSMVVELTFAVEPDGTVADVERQKGAGLPGFDDAPRDLLRDLGRVPVPSSAVRSDDGRAYVKWRFTRKEPGCEEGEVTERHLPIEQAVVRLVESGAPERAVARLLEARQAEPAKEGALLALLGAALGRISAGSNDPSTRAAAALVLAHVEDGEALLLKLATDKDAAVRRAGLEALGTHSPATARGERSRETLVKALGGVDRATAARALGKLGDQSARPALRAALKAGQSPADVVGAMVALGDGDEAGRITAELLGGDAKTRLAGAQAARVLADPALGASLVAAFTVANDELRVAILEALAASGKRITAEERKTILHALKDPSAKVRARAWAALVASGDRSASMRTRLIDALAEPDAGVRAVVAAALVEVGGGAATDEVARGARDRSPQVRAAVARALIAHPFDGASHILRKLDSDGDATVKAALAESRQAAALGKAGAPRPAELAERVLKAATPLERLRAAAVYLAAVIAIKK